MSTMHIQSDATIEFILQQISETHDVWERHTHQKELAVYLSNNPEWVQKYWNDLDIRTKYYYHQMKAEKQQANESQ